MDRRELILVGTEAQLALIREAARRAEDAIGGLGGAFAAAGRAFGQLGLPLREYVTLPRFNPPGTYRGRPLAGRKRRLRKKLMARLPPVADDRVYVIDAARATARALSGAEAVTGALGDRLVQEAADRIRCEIDNAFLGPSRLFGIDTGLEVNWRLQIGTAGVGKIGG